MRTAFLLTLLACGGAPSGPTGPDAVTADGLRADVEVLASDAFKGRGTGEPGAEMAATFVESAFTRAGLAPLPGRQGLRVPYTLYRRGWDPDATTLTLTVGEAPTRAAIGADFRPFGFSDAGTADAELVFAGYGISAPGLGWDDYADLDVTGKIVLVFRHDPGEATEGDVWDTNSGHALFTTKARAAQEHGAVGMIVVTDPLNHEADDDLRPEGRLELEPPKPGEPRGEGDEPPFLAIQMSRAAVAPLVAGTGLDLAGLQTAVNAGEHRNGSLGARVSLAIARRETPEAVSAVNVVGVLEGTEHPDQWVVIGAHHDHLGAFDGAGDTVYNGADDNASGTAGLLALAQAFASRPERPARSIVFASFSGEELGLLGSRALVRDGVIDPSEVVFMLNLDMIGRDDAGVVEVTGDAYATGLHDAIAAAAAAESLELTWKGTDYQGNSDHHSFWEADVPVAFFFTGLHDDYHQLADHADKLDYDRMARIVRAGFGVVDPVASGALTPRFVHHVGWLGLIVALEERDGKVRPIVTEVEPDSRGASAGFQVGDAVTAFADVPLERPEAVGAAFRAIEPGTTTRITVDRPDLRITLSADRAKTGYLGVWPDSPTDEQRTALGLRPDEGVVIRRVIPDGPAAAAGLQDGDVLVRIRGIPVDLRSLSKTLTRIGAGEEVPIDVIRGEQRLGLTLVLGERPE